MKFWKKILKMAVKYLLHFSLFLIEPSLNKYLKFNKFTSEFTKQNEKQLFVKRFMNTILKYKDHKFVSQYKFDQ